MEEKVMLQDNHTLAVRNMLQKFNSDLGLYIDDERRHKLGRVLTIVDASIADNEQRKAVKDLIRDMWWSDTTSRPADGHMISPHADIRAICEVMGFELYPETDFATTLGESEFSSQYALGRYKEAAKKSE